MKGDLKEFTFSFHANRAICRGFEASGIRYDAIVPSQYQEKDEGADFKLICENDGIASSVFIQHKIPEAMHRRNKQSGEMYDAYRSKRNKSNSKKGDPVYFRISLRKKDEYRQQTALVMSANNSGKRGEPLYCAPSTNNMKEFFDNLETKGFFENNFFFDARRVEYDLKLKDLKKQHYIAFHPELLNESRSNWSVHSDEPPSFHETESWKDIVARMREGNPIQGPEERSRDQNGINEMDLVMKRTAEQMAKNLDEILGKITRHSERGPISKRLKEVNVILMTEGSSGDEIAVSLEIIRDILIRDFEIDWMIVGTRTPGATRENIPIQ
jgi:hypothetical protein